MKVCSRCKSPNLDADWACPKCAFKPKLIHGIRLFEPSASPIAGAYHAGHYQALYEGERKHFWFQARASLIRFTLASYGQKVPNSFLEIGCGTGFLLKSLKQHFSDWNLIGTEISADGLQYTRSLLPDEELLQMDARRIPYADEFGAIGAFDVLEHIEDDLRVLRECHSALRPGGLLLLTVPQHASLWSTYDEQAGHFRRYEREDLQRKLTDAGFDVERMTSFVSLLLPAMSLQRRLARGNKDVNIDDQLTINPLLNGFFSLVMALERNLISMGFNFKRGGSLLAVARRRE